MSGQRFGKYSVPLSIPNTDDYYEEYLLHGNFLGEIILRGFWLLLFNSITNRNVKIYDLLKLMDFYSENNFQLCKCFQCEVTEESKWKEIGSPGQTCHVLNNKNDLSVV